MYPLQLEVRMRLDCEAAIHAVCEFADTHAQHTGAVIMKLDVAKAFNIVHRSAALREVFRRYHMAAASLVT